MKVGARDLGKLIHVRWPAEGAGRSRYAIAEDRTAVKAVLLRPRHRAPSQ
jgi:hypothetical protein